MRIALLKSSPHFLRPNRVPFVTPYFASLMVGALLAALVLFLVIVISRLTIRISRIESALLVLQTDDERAERNLREEFGRNRQETADQLRDNREELNNSLHRLTDHLGSQLSLLSQRNGDELEKLRSVIELKLSSIQKDNGERLDQIRQTVDEKLHSTLEQRLGESFKLVSERLELVHRGL